ncbi:hypothetical protein [Methylocystis echinoides]|uniref:Uncharacterized protein n=1 Tax=Methylocystis echinoides TaxID=29468 RepID=A0A9W6GRU9_9HYPH|nr:hypothetical protein [Methylocystis echinoides]GLI91859.1 hypothetical protein LMG27198_08510 [Methylocystis echinoides]
MLTIFFFLFAFDFGWRGYGFLAHLWLPLAMFVVMAAYSYSGAKTASYSNVDVAFGLSIFFELACFLPAWALGRGARRVFGGGKPYSLKMSFDM